MIWKKADDAARDWCGGINKKLLYAAVTRDELKAARVGAGRNLLFCEQWCDEWLMSSAAKPYKRNAEAGKASAFRIHRVGDGEHITATG